MPRRPVGVDMRPTTGRAIVVFAVIPAVVVAYSLARHHQRRDYWFGFRWGLLAVCGFVGYAWARSIRFESLHLDGTAEFWLERERLIRPRFFNGCLASLGASILAALVARGVGAFAEAGFATAVGAFAGTVVMLMWGKVP